MAAKDIAVKKYVVRLGAEEREQLQALIRYAVFSRHFRPIAPNALIQRFIRTLP